MCDKSGRAPMAGAATPPRVLAQRIGLALEDPVRSEALANEIASICINPSSRESNLCADGDPVELAFVWPDEDARFTCDPTPGASVGRRLDAALRHCDGLSAGQIHLVEGLAAAQGDEAKYGAWIGVRWRRGTIARKLYLEVASAAAIQQCAAIVGPKLSNLPIRAMQPVMAGFDLLTGGAEIYYRTAPLTSQALTATLQNLEFPAFGRRIADEIAQLSGCSALAELPTPNQGLSLALDAGGSLLAFSWYAYAASLLGPPDHARAAILEHCWRRGWTADRYQATTASDSGRQTPFHAIVGVTAHAADGVAVSITCSCGAGGK